MGDEIGKTAGAGGKLSQAALGRVLDLSPAAITKLKGQGMPVDSVEAARAWRAARQNIAQRKADPGAGQPSPVAREPEPQPAPYVPGEVMRDMIMGKGPKARAYDDGGDALEEHDEARTRREIAEANIAEIKEAELKGRYVDKSAVDRATFEAARGLRDALTNCSRRMAAEVATLSTPGDCEAVIAKELRHLLETFVQQLSAKATNTNANPHPLEQA